MIHKADAVQSKFVCYRLMLVWFLTNCNLKGLVGRSSHSVE